MNANELELVQGGLASFPENAPFWTRAREGRFCLPRCRACGKTHWFPRAFCPLCFSPELEWVDSPGTGSVYTFSRLAGPAGERVIAYVRLDEGHLMLTELVDTDEQLAIDQRVRVVMQEFAPGLWAPRFRPER